MKNDIKSKIEEYKNKGTSRFQIQEDKLNQKIPFKPFHLMKADDKEKALEARDLYFQELYAKRDEMKSQREKESQKADKLPVKKK